MIKVRNKEGKRWQLSNDIVFVELCDQQGNLGCLICNLPGGEISVSMPGDDTFDNYVKAYKSKTADYIVRYSKNERGHK